MVISCTIASKTASHPESESVFLGILTGIVELIQNEMNDFYNKDVICSV